MFRTGKINVHILALWVRNGSLKVVLSFFGTTRSKASLYVLVGGATGSDIFPTVNFSDTVQVMHMTKVSGLNIFCKQRACDSQECFLYQPKRLHVLVC